MLRIFGKMLYRKRFGNEEMRRYRIILFALIPTEMV